MKSDKKVNLKNLTPPLKLERKSKVFEKFIRYQYRTKMHCSNFKTNKRVHEKIKITGRGRKKSRQWEIY